MIRFAWIGCSALWMAVGMLAEESGSILTVSGWVDPEDIGKALSHEHVLVDFAGADVSGYHRWNREEVSSKILPRLREIKALGYQSLFECTPAYLGRDPVLLRMLSELSGILLVTNTGYYGARENRYVPDRVQEMSIDALANVWIREFSQGIERTGIRPGFIKIGVDSKEGLSPFHERLVRAACRTHLETGLMIASHTGPSDVIFDIANILSEEGVSPNAFIWVHATRAGIPSLLRAAEIGFWISIDNLRENANLLAANVERIVALKDAGYLNRVLISQDAGWYRPGEENGGTIAPYTFVENGLVPSLKQKGFSDAEIDQLLEVNVARAYGVCVRRY